MKICIFGAGAIGGFVGAKLADAGAEVSMVARGAHLSEMKKNGLTLLEDGLDPKRITVRVAQDPLELGAQDYVFVTLKAHSVPYVAESMSPLFHDDTTIVSGVNGIPWWYFHKIGGELEGTRLSSVDPDITKGVLASSIKHESISSTIEKKCSRWTISFLEYFILSLR